MIEEVSLKTHLIVTQIEDIYKVKWTGQIINADPLFVNNKPVFIIISSNHRLELNTIDMKFIEDSAKKILEPQGRQSTTTDKAFIFIKEKNGNEYLLGSVTQFHIKHYSQMYDKIGYRQ